MGPWLGWVWQGTFKQRALGALYRCVRASRLVHLSWLHHEPHQACRSSSYTATYSPSVPALHFGASVADRFTGTPKVTTSHGLLMRRGCDLCAYRVAVAIALFRRPLRPARIAFGVVHRAVPEAHSLRWSSDHLGRFEDGPAHWPAWGAGSLGSLDDQPGGSCRPGVALRTSATSYAQAESGTSTRLARS